MEVKAAGVVPNLRNVVTNYPKWFPFLPLPKLPAIYGLDSAGAGSQTSPSSTNAGAGLMRWRASGPKRRA